MPVSPDTLEAIRAASSVDPFDYDASYREGHYRDTYIVESLPPVAVAMNRWVVDFTIASLGLLPGDRVLDLGAGVGWLLPEWRRRGIDAVGLELSQTAVDHRIDPGVQQGNVCDLSRFPNQSFACAISLSLLEHLTMRECASMSAEVRRVAWSSAHFISHDRGNDPSHINVHKPALWKAWFAEDFEPNGWHTFVLPNALVPPMPLFLQVQRWCMPLQLQHAMEMYHIE